MRPRVFSKKILTASTAKSPDITPANRIAAAAGQLSSSFRDPSGFIFSHDGCLYRQVNQSYADQYDRFMASGLYTALVDKGWIVAHDEVAPGTVPQTDTCHKILKPRQIPFIAYPYEWSFSQLKAAAMLTLKIQHAALKHGFVLKDASAFNIQFDNARPVFIDTLSFEPYQAGTPWVAYRQFCQHFLAPLALMAYCDVQLSKLTISHIDGVPLPLASKLLPLRTRLNPSLFTHIHLHARMQAAHGDDAGNARKGEAGTAHVSQKGIVALGESLASAINRLDWKLPRTEWGNYYENTNYSDNAGQQKRQLVDAYLDAIPDPLHIVQDLGANTGEFSRVAARHANLVVSQDIDPVAVETNYRLCREAGPTNILPLVQDLSAPSPAIGWANHERDSFMHRSHGDALLVLALIHHLAISNNLPLENIAATFRKITLWLIIEFVPKSDSQVARLLATREDIFPDYTEAGFEAAFAPCFEMRKRDAIEGSERTLYLMRAI